jgi:superfamily II DNA or RNA helicase
MAEDELERVMVDFVAHRHDILLATTIVENGLDIPNANTIVVNRADRYGLAQLYQLRGRVGRSDRRAYAYLLVPAEQTLSPIARKRLAAIREFSDLGSGFRIAALDLEIRGAGNLLGGEQSGHIEAVGFDMYMKLLEQTIRELKAKRSRTIGAPRSICASTCESTRPTSGHESAAVGISPDGQRAARSEDRCAFLEELRRSLRDAARVRAAPGAICPHPADGRSDRARGLDRGGLDRGLKVQGRDARVDPVLLLKPD